MKIAKIGIFLDEKAEEKCWARGENVFERYTIEILDAAKVPYEVIHNISAIATQDIVIVGIAEATKQTKDTLMDYVKNGGIIIGYGNLDFLCQSLGYVEKPAITKGYAYLDQTFVQESPLRYLEAKPWEALSETRDISIGRISGETTPTSHEHNDPALQQIEVGEGFIDRWAINIPKTIVGIQQGTEPVTTDGKPAPDGSADLNEGILKADDGFELDWELDRDFTETGVPYFSIPYADLWKEVMLEHLIARALGKGLQLPIIDKWPAGIDHVATISHDSDINDNDSAELTLDVLKGANIHTTWCIMQPGYSREIYQKVKEAGHELAFHYNALEQENEYWSAKSFHDQLAWLKEVTAKQDIITNKNHYTRFEGWGELFRWCEEQGIQVDQSRGPSKKGNIGFLFGTCQPYYPIAWASEKNRFYDVLEIGFLTQDLNHQLLADTSVIAPFLKQVKRVNGVAHFLFHQIHIYKQPKVKEAIIQLIETARKEGFTFWTSEQINQWERKRRNIHMSVESDKLQLTSPAEMEEVTVWIPVRKTGQPHPDEKVVYGVICKKEVCEVQQIKEKRWV